MIWIQLIPVIIQLIVMAEKLFNEKNKGADKKEFVTQGLKAIVDIGEAVSTGGQKQTWKAIAPLADSLIDSIAAIATTKGE